jgi:hypothetical protein
MDLKIKIPIPINLETNRIPYFTKLNTYKYRIPQVREIKKVFVTHEGIVLKNGLIVKGCAFNTHGNKDNNFKLTFWKTALEQMLVCRFGKSLPFKKYSKKTYTIIHTKWFNYAFWVNSSIVRLLNLKEKGLLDTTILLVPEKIFRIPFVHETLEQFDIKIQIIPNGNHMFIDHFIHTETRDWSTEFSPKELIRLRNFLIPIAERKTNEFKLKSDKIYLSRKKRGIRSIENEIELESFLQQHGFITIYFEDYDIWEQIKIMTQAKIFISIHGAGCTNILFMSKGSNFIELINQPYSEIEYKFPFWKIAMLSNIVYHPIFCPIKSSNDKLKISYGKKKNNLETEYLVNQNIIVDLTILDNVLKNSNMINS